MKTIPQMTKVVIDTNVLVASLSSKSIYHWLVEAILNEQIDVCVTDEILFEYDEILSRKYAPVVANNFLTALKELPNVHFTQVFFKWDLISDKDDNKFVDCFVAAGATYLVTHDSHFSILKSIPFPSINVVNIDEFKTQSKL
jgi:putative PIN family toxin of toxin-antitoxin system